LKFLLTLFAVLLLGAGAGVVGLKVLQHHILAPGPLTQTTTVFIAPGTGVRQMAEQLQSANVVSYKQEFVGIVALRGLTTRLKAGEYEFTPRISLNDAIDKMVRGDVIRRMVTVPEGLSSFEAAKIITAAPEMDGAIETPAEGSLLPETYSYIRGDARSKIVAEMQSAMTKTLNDLWDHRAANLPFATKEEALTLASIVEKETRVASERPRVAGVYINRLRKGMMLQSDPTVIYAITKGESKIDRVLYAHLETDSPYNTYKNIGLPPGPICNPGKASIAAVLQPETNDYLYFVADGTGAHVFAATAAEHEANVLKWRTAQKAARAAAAAAPTTPSAPTVP